jgi:magnesium transporter
MKEIIDDLHLEDLRNEEHPSIFDENEKYDILIVRLPVIDNKLENKSIGFVITEDSSFIYDISDNKFKELGGRFEGPYKIIDKMVDKLLKSFVKYNDLIADMEEALYENKATDSFMTDWLWLKHDILRIERVLMRSSFVMNEVFEYYAEVDNFPINHYMDLHEHLERTLRSASLQLSKLDYLYNFHNARTNEKMNRFIYILTILSAIFLPLNLLVGFFGMNTSGLPFTQGNIGTFNVGLVMASLLFGSIIATYFIQKRS